MIVKKEVLGRKKGFSDRIGMLKKAWDK